MTNTAELKKLLEEEKARLEDELKNLGNKEVGSDGEWTPTPPPDITHESDPIDQADAIEEYADRIGVEVPLEERYKQVLAAIASIESGDYGTCTVGGTPHDIESERLEANPAASTCMTHMNG